MAVKTRLQGKIGKSAGRRTPVVVSIARLTIFISGSAAAIPRRIPAPTAAIYSASCRPISRLPVNPMVFKIPRFLYSCSIPPAMLYPRIIITPPQKDECKCCHQGTECVLQNHHKSFYCGSAVHKFRILGKGCVFI